MTLKLNFMKGLGYMQPLEYLQMVVSKNIFVIFCPNIGEETKFDAPYFFKWMAKHHQKRYCSLSMQLAWWVWIVAGHLIHFNHWMGKNQCHCLAICLVEARSPEHLHQGRLGESFCNQIVASFFDLMLYWCTWQWFMQSVFSKPCFAGFSLLSWRWTIQKGVTKMEASFLNMKWRWHKSMNIKFSSYKSYI